VASIREQGLNFDTKKQEQASQKLKNKKIVLTGSLPSLTRKEAAQLIEKHGGKTTSSVSGNTDYLLAGESPGSKYDKAVELNIPIIDQHAFLDLIDENVE